MSVEDMEIKLLSGVPIYVDKYVGSIEPLTIRDIAEIGYSKYNLALNFLSQDPFDLIELKEEIEDIRGMDILLLAGGVLTDHFIETLQVIFKTDHITPVPQEGFVIIGEIIEEELENGTFDNPILTPDSYDKFKEIVLLQNGVKSLDEAEQGHNPKDDVAQSIIDKLNKNKQEVQKYKNKGKGSDEETTTLADIISAVSCKSNSINKLNIFDLTIYQLYDDYKRLVAIESYQIGIDSMLQGAKQKDLKHWSAKIN